MTLPVIFSLNNPMLSPILIMVACFMLGFMVAYTALRIGRDRKIGRSIREYAKTELDRLETRHTWDMERIALLEDQVMTHKVKLAHIALFLGKAITEVEIGE